MSRGQLAVLLATTAALAGCERMVPRQIANAVEAAAALERELMAPGVFEGVLCGSGGPFPNASRVQACTAIFANGQFLLFDVGDGAQESMELLQLPTQRVTAVFITHFHNDHLADLGETIDRSWIFGRRHVLPVYGPTGVSSVVDGFDRAYRLEYGFRTAHHGEDLMPPGKQAARAVPIALSSSQPQKLVYDSGGVRVHAFLVDHHPVAPALGYAVEYDGRRVVISGDTDDTPMLREQARGADVLVSEVMNKRVVQLLSDTLAANGRPEQSRILVDVQDYHIDVGALGQLAEQARVKRLVLTHLVPPVDSGRLMRQWFGDAVAEHYSGDLILGEDGTRFGIGD